MCRQEGKVCDRTTGRCRVAKGGKKKQNPSTSLVAGAVMGAVGSQTAASLASGRKSKKLGAGMATMVSLTRRKLPGGSVSPSDRLLYKQFQSRELDRHFKGITKVRGQKVCAPRKGKDGTVYETVPKTGVYATGKLAGQQYTRCVKAGGAAAKEKRSDKACGAGQVLIRYTTTVPNKETGGKRVVDATRCVKAQGKHKDCFTDQVLVRAMASGRTPQGKAWSKMVQKCMDPKAAAQRAYPVVRQGTLERPYLRVTKKGKVVHTKRFYAEGGKRMSSGKRMSARRPRMSARRPRMARMAMSPGI